jgi:hypothetical protein
MAVVFGYIAGEAASHDEEFISGYCRARRLKLGRVFKDDVCKGPWLGRPSGEKLAAALQPHDAVVAPNLGAIYSSPQALLGAVELLKARDAVLHIARFESRFLPDDTKCLILTGDVGTAVLVALRIAASFKDATRSEAIADGLAALKAADPDGRHANHAGYGYAWRRGKRVEHAAEREQMAAIVRYRQAGYSFNDIYFHFLKNRVKTKAGREWSVARIRLAYKAALALGLGGTSPAQPVPSQS